MPAREWITERRGEVRVGSPARVLVDGDRVTGVRVRDQLIEAPVVISTVPWHAFAALFDDVPPSLRDTAANAAALGSLPIVTVNLWFDRAVMSEALVGLPGRNFQWVFDRRALVGSSASHLSLTSSGAETIVNASNDQLTAMAMSEIEKQVRSSKVLVIRKRPAP